MEAGVEHEKCGNGKLCDRLASLVRPDESTAPGIVASTFVIPARHTEEKINRKQANTVGLEFLVSCVAYRKSVKSDSIIFNYCPFCGEKINRFWNPG
jgi:hypothetical protein